MKKDRHNVILLENSRMTQGAVCLNRFFCQISQFWLLANLQRTHVLMKQLILGKMTDFGSRIRGKIWMCRLDFDVRALESKPSPSRCLSPEIWPKRNAVSYRTFHFLTIIQLDNLLTKKTFNQKFFVFNGAEHVLFTSKFSDQKFRPKNFVQKFTISGTKWIFDDFWINYCKEALATYYWGTCT